MPLRCRLAAHRGFAAAAYAAVSAAVSAAISAADSSLAGMVVLPLLLLTEPPRSRSSSAAAVAAPPALDADPAICTRLGGTGRAL